MNSTKAKAPGQELRPQQVPSQTGWFFEHQNSELC